MKKMLVTGQITSMFSEIIEVEDDEFENMAANAEEKYIEMAQDGDITFYDTEVL